MPSSQTSTSYVPSLPVDNIPSPRRQLRSVLLDPSPQKGQPGLKSDFILPGKRGKVIRLVLAAIIFFPPMAIFLLAIFLLAILPFIVLTTVILSYSAAWFVYWVMAEPASFADLPLDPRRVMKLNRAVFGVIVSNLTLIPIGISLAQYRFWTMRSAADYIIDVPYNPKRPSKKLDIYIPDGQGLSTLPGEHEPKSLRPVIVFIYGGAWSSGSKLLYTLVGARLRSMGYLVIIPDYTIYPFGVITHMEQDVKMAIQWTHRHCKRYGGDPQKLYIMGHSAGAHLCALTVLNDCIRRVPISMYGSSPAAVATSPILTTLLKECDERESKDDVLPRLRGMILFSGVYNIGEHYKHESMRCVEHISAMARVMGKSESTFRQYSPTNILQELLQVSTRIDRHYSTESQTRHHNLLRHLKSLLPIETLVIHGDLDQTVPARSSSEFHMELKTMQLGSAARLRIMHGMGHEEPVVALMECIGRVAPFRKPLMDEISQFIDGDKYVKKIR
ncbi:hypothetical protein BX616_002786 [Lobosporangium transversale]|uniref:Alpha/Beta hydrolase protein n=1 Tax=Lobosporangium transversale TaxID=64571 RepID=A0A1Y2GEL9_9FUNG|nr:Alpha/Beta hydrolase protein [Lobosporangium transversale]KAF9899902.1 hypothetical protein BX616_002786 [Lobosporangium transversale]ORZ07276.1 Alpha/Beta hydrolase protein [Lobosporangium transversale]|eukprot:XP_021877939.1 Alpha/Beta hydrolase protein [Lobosporangium transversale]